MSDDHLFEGSNPAVEAAHRRYVRLMDAAREILDLDRDEKIWCNEDEGSREDRKRWKRVLETLSAAVDEVDSLGKNVAPLPAEADPVNALLQDSARCYAELCQVRRIMSDKRSTPAEWDAAAKMCGLVLLNCKDKDVADVAYATVQELTLRRNCLAMSDAVNAPFGQD